MNYGFIHHYLLLGSLSIVASYGAENTLSDHIIYPGSLEDVRLTLLKANIKDEEITKAVHYTIRQIKSNKHAVVEEIFRKLDSNKRYNFAKNINTYFVYKIEDENYQQLLRTNQCSDPITIKDMSFILKTFIKTHANQQMIMEFINNPMHKKIDLTEIADDVFSQYESFLWRKPDQYITGLAEEWVKKMVQSLNYTQEDSVLSFFKKIYHKSMEVYNRKFQNHTDREKNNAKERIRDSFVKLIHNDERLKNKDTFYDLHIDKQFNKIDDFIYDQGLAPDFNF